MGEIPGRSKVRMSGKTGNERPQRARALILAATMTGATAAVALATASSAAGGAATSTSACPSNHVTVPNKDDFTSNASNTTFDATSTAWNQKSGVDDYSVKMNSGGGSGNCYMGGSITGTNSITSKT